MRPSRRLLCIGLLGITAALAFGASAEAPAVPVGRADLPAPADPQTWVLPSDMTWADYVPIPGFDWASDPSLQAVKPLRTALVLGDFEDQPFVMTLPDGSDLAGNPQRGGSVPREEVGRWYADFLNTPNQLNRGHTMNEYWLENSYGLIGVDVEPFGPYAMDFKSHEYGLGADAGGAGDACPAEDECSQDMDTELVQKSLVDITTGQVTNGEDYDFRYLLHAGYDESGTWQEFGEMKFRTDDAVTDEFGPPDEDLPNSADTRYVDWTSWWAAKGIWSHALPGALSTQGENDGASVFAHELSHILGVLDNYNNPYGNPVSRAYSGPWDMLSRGTFNGPGGPHHRWEIPADGGGSMGSHHMLRNKLRLGFLRPDEVMVLDRNTLQAAGPIFADVWTREIPLGPTRGRTGLHGIQIRMLDGDNTPSCTLADDHRCDGGGYTAYTLEVVDRIGTDSFLPDHGVLIAKTKDVDTAPFIWVVDAHPEDIDLVDFVRPGGGEAKISLGDYRQLADALLHAGTGPKVVSEHLDEPNQLHFYVLEQRRDEEQVLSYRVAVRSTAAAPRAGAAVTVAATDPSAEASAGYVDNCGFTATNGGATTDLVRVSATAPSGWATQVADNVVELAGGATAEIPVYVRVPAGTAAGTTVTVTLTATSETNPAATASETCTVRAAAGGAAAPVTPPAPPAPPRPGAAPTGPRPPLAATGPGDLLPVLALLTLSAAVAVRRRHRT